MPEIDPAIDVGLQHDILVSHIGENPSQAASAISSFFEEVYRFCVRALGDGVDLGDRALAFALSEHGIDVDPVYDEHSDAFVPSGRLDRDCTAEIGPVLLATRNLRMAYSTHSEETDAAGVAKRLKELGLGDRPTAVFIGSQRTLLVYRTGVNQKPMLEARTDQIAALDPSDMEGVLQYFHENWTRYPSGYGTCWDNATARIVERNAERNIRNHLHIFLGFVVYRSKFVVREYDRPNGRVDIFVFGVAMNGPEHDYVLELKVLRSRSIGWSSSSGKTRTYSDASNHRYVERGLRQAKRYIDSTDAARAYLLCYDARLDDVEVPVQDYAGTLGVDYRRFFMESSVTED